MTSSRRATRTAMISAVAALAFATGNDAAWAQTATPAAAAPLAVDSKPDCGEKPDYPGRLASDAQRRNWQKAANTYIECLKKYVTAKQEVAQVYMKSANEAIDQYNAAIKELEEASKGN